MSNSTHRKKVNVYLTVAGEKTNFKTLELTQEYGQHHHFTIGLDYDFAGNSFMENPLEQIELIGRLVIMQFYHDSDKSKTQTFRGIITEVQNEGEAGRNGRLIIKGSSPTIMLEKGRRMDAYSRITLYNVFNKLIDGVYSDYLKCVNAPTFENKIDFLMQYNETDWQFLQRVAYLHGENLFYSGTEIIFGAYDEWDTAPMTYNKEITDIRFCSRMRANSFEPYLYIAEHDQLLEKVSPNGIENSNDLLDQTAEQNSALTANKPARNILNAPVSAGSEMNEIQKRDKSRRAAQTVCVEGKSNSIEAWLGRVISIDMPEGMASRRDMGKYRIIKVTHSMDEGQYYSSVFEGVPASLVTMPVKEPWMPTADSVLAKVVSNEDPKGIGRVQVDFKFANQYTKAWLRVMTPNGGSSEKVNTNRGLVFVPEKGDQVMIGFEYGDPNRPYVMGSMFHGKNGAGGDANNQIKSIITRSGIKIVFNDDEESLHIEDPSGNTWDMDGKGNIEVHAPENMTLNAKNINMNAKEDITSTSGNNTNIISNNDVNISVSNKYELSAQQSHSIIGKEVIEVAEKIEQTADRININSTKEDMTLYSSKKVNLQSSDKINLF